MINVKNAFTLAEVLIAITVIGVIAAITVPVLTARYHEQETVSKVKKMYSVISQAFREYQIENGCTEDAADCFELEGNVHGSFNKALEKYLNFSSAVYPNDKISDIKWLPETSKYLNGTLNNDSWHGVWKSRHSSAIRYLLSDGTLLHAHIPDNHLKSGFVFFDVNGIKGPNQAGKDQFPISIGAYNNDKYKNSVHPYYNEDDLGNRGGLCNITNNHECSADECTKNSCSPTAYVLKHSKLPPL